MLHLCAINCWDSHTCMQTLLKSALPKLSTAHFWANSQHMLFYNTYIFTISPQRFMSTKIDFGLCQFLIKLPSTSSGILLAKAIKWSKVSLNLVWNCNRLCCPKLACSALVAHYIIKSRKMRPESFHSILFVKNIEQTTLKIIS